MRCSYKFKQNNRIRCGQAAGHTGTHSCYEKTGDAEFRVYQENDNGETPCTAEEEKFEVFQVDYDLGRDERGKTMELAIERARASLGKGVVFEIRAQEYPTGDRSVNFGRKKMSRRELAESWGIAWYHMPKQTEGFESLNQKQSPLFIYDVDDGETITLGGYVLLARIKA